MKISDEQIKTITEQLEYRRVENLYSELKVEEYPYLSNNEIEAKKQISEKIKLSKEFDFKTEEYSKKLIQMFFTEKKLNENKFNDEINNILSWPGRDDETKIEYLEELINSK